MQPEYVDPRTLPEVLDLLARHGDAARLLAGGQSLLPLVHLRLFHPQVLVDISRVEGLRYIRAEGDVIRLGATTRHREVEQSALLQARCPLLAAAAGHIGHSHVRGRGTLGGSVSHADPAAEYPAALLALEAGLRLASAAGERTVPAAEFFLAPLVTCLAPGELLVQVTVPALPGWAWSFREFALRSGDFALVCAAVLLDLDPEGTVRAARIAVGNAGPTPLRCPEAEAFLAGQAVRRPDEPGGAREVLARAGRLAAGELDPADDIHASAAYRRDLAAILVRDALEEAVARGNP